MQKTNIRQLKHKRNEPQKLEPWFHNYRKPVSSEASLEQLSPWEDIWFPGCEDLVACLLLWRG